MDAARIWIIDFPDLIGPLITLISGALNFKLNNNDFLNAYALSTFRSAPLVSRVSPRSGGGGGLSVNAWAVGAVGVRAYVVERSDPAPDPLLSHTDNF